MDQEGQEQQPTSVSSEAGALKTSEKGTKKTYKILIPVLIIIAFAGVVFGVYGIFMAPKPQDNCIVSSTTYDNSTPSNSQPDEQTPQETPEPTEQEANSSKSNSSPLSFVRSFDNVVNNKHKDYYNKYESLSNIKIYYYNNEEEEPEYYYINCNSELCKLFKENGDEYATINNFQSKIRDYYYIGFGQGYGYEQLFFVMEDGSVEYIQVHKAFSEKDFKSNGKIENLNNIIKIHSVESSSYDYEDRLLSRGRGALAEDTNGNFYDLYRILYPSE